MVILCFTAIVTFTVFIFSLDNDKSISDKSKNNEIYHIYCCYYGKKCCISKDDRLFETKSID